MSIQQKFPFQQVRVAFDVENAVRVEWVLDRRFTDPAPHVFQLQAAMTSVPTANDFQDVGGPVTNGFFALDNTGKRLYGKSLDRHYRVKLTTPKGTYYSEPASAFSLADFRDWRLIREMLRQDIKKLKKYSSAYEGFLLKKKRYGPPCPVCTDTLTGESSISSCPGCYGTGFEGGYYPPVPMLVDLGQEQSREHRDELKAVGMVKPMVVSGAATAIYTINSGDVFCHKRSGRRWQIETVAVAQHHRGIPVRLQLELRQLPFSDIIYKIPLE